MSKVYTHKCDIDESTEVILAIDVDWDIWIYTTGDVKLDPESARDLAEQLIKFADDADGATK